MIIRFFSSSSKNIFAKILFGAIILSFGLWGVGDIIRNYVESKTAISVGKLKIPADYFAREYSQMKQNIKNSREKPLTEDEFNKMKLKDTIIDSIIDKAVEEETMRQLGIVIPKRSLASMIHSLPELQTNGVFDERLYIALLRQSGISEAGLLNQLKNNIARTQLFHPIIVGYKIPSFINNALGSVYESNKTIHITKININDTKISDKIDQATLSQYYQNNTDKYKLPERRDVAVLKIDYTKFIDNIKVTDQEIEVYCRENKEVFKSEENRDFERFEFSTKEEADNAHTKLNQGQSKGLIKKLLANSQILKEMKKTEFPENISRNIFSLKEEQISNVYLIGGKYYIYKVKKIYTPIEKNKEEIKKEARIILQNEKVNSPEFYTTIKDIKAKIDDSFAAGKDIDKVARETKAEIIEIKKLSKNNNSELIKIVPDGDTRKEIQENIFTMAENQASPIIESKEIDTIAYVVWVRKVQKETIPPLNEIKDKVKNDYIFEQKNKATIDYMNELINDKTSKKIKEHKNTKTFVISKKDIIMKSDNENVKQIVEEIPNYEILMDILSTIYRNKTKYYRISDNEYVLVNISKIEQPKQASNTMLYIVNKYINNSTANDILMIAKKEFKDRQKIKKDHKIINERTKVQD